MKSKVLFGVALALSLFAVPSASYAQKENKDGSHAATQRGGSGHGGGGHARSQGNRGGEHARSQGHRGGGGHAQQRTRGHAQQRAHGNRGSAHHQRPNVRRQNVQRSQHRNVRRHERNIRRDRGNITRNKTTIRKERNVNKKVINQNRKAENRDARRGKRIRFSSEQRNRARSYYRSHRDRFHRVARVAWPIVIGSYVPRDYTIYDIPDDYYGYVPGYEGYKYIVVGDELLIIDPETLEIVAIIPI